jgi:hypothetical protein
MQRKVYEDRVALKAVQIGEKADKCAADLIKFAAILLEDMEVEYRKVNGAEAISQDSLVSFMESENGGALGTYLFLQRNMRVHVCPITMELRLVKKRSWKYCELFRTIGLACEGEGIREMHIELRWKEMAPC